MLLNIITLMPIEDNGECMSCVKVIGAESELSLNFTPVFIFTCPPAMG